jgi:hypothetical protein
VIPFHRPHHDLAQFWIDRLAPHGPAEISPAQIAHHNARVAELISDNGPTGRWDLRTLALDAETVRAQLRASLDHLKKGVAEGRRVLARGDPPTALLALFARETEESRYADEIRVAHRETALRCFPSDEGIYEAAWDTAFDLLQCARVRLGEPVRVAAKGSRFWYVWTTYGKGWVDPGALTPPLTPDEVSAFLEPTYAAVGQADRVPIFSERRGGRLLGALRLGIQLPWISEHGPDLEVLAPTPGGLRSGWLRRSAFGAPLPHEVSVGYPPLTRENLLRRAFALLNTPYGWGGLGGGRDCSRLMMDLFGAFGVLLPRNSWNQSLAGLRRVAVGSLSERAKIETIEAAAREAIVLLYLPGHIMLYLGRDGDHLYAFHLFSGYLVPCEGGGETMTRVNRAVVTSLELGRGSSRSSFIERIRRLILFEPEPVMPCADPGPPPLKPGP